MPWTLEGARVDTAQVGAELLGAAGGLAHRRLAINLVGQIDDLPEVGLDGLCSPAAPLAPMLDHVNWRVFRSVVP
ncbi:MAG: hypothetical protein M3O70_00040 [Actinomycetota bacterium]|nr:hypothetical protein [Actinomycetota bacterium]